MNYFEIIGESTNTLNFLLLDKLPDVDSEIINEIKVEAQDALRDVLVKYKLIDP